MFGQRNTKLCNSSNRVSIMQYLLGGAMYLPGRACNGWYRRGTRGQRVWLGTGGEGGQGEKHSRWRARCVARLGIARGLAENEINVDRPRSATVSKILQEISFVYLPLIASLLPKSFCANSSMQTKLSQMYIYKYMDLGFNSYETFSSKRG